jgi:hypothetical protein
VRRFAAAPPQNHRESNIVIRNMTLVFFVLLQTAGAADRSLSSFSVDGLMIGKTTLDAFKQKAGRIRVPEAEESDVRNGLEVFLVVQVPSCDGIRCWFLDGILYRIDVVYLQRTIEKMGGLDIAVDALNSYYGVSSKSETVDTVSGNKAVKYNWANSERRAEFRALPTCAIFEVADTQVESKLAERRAKNVNLGF